jgi:hypothetical protein
VHGREQPVEKSLYAPSGSPSREGKTPPSQCFSLDIYVFGCGFGLPSGPITTFSIGWEFLGS